MSQRFSVESELSRIDTGLVSDAQKEWGVSVEWFRFDEDATVVDDLYDVGATRRWQAPLRIPALWVIRDEGRDTYDQDGLYVTETLQIALSKSVLRDKLHWVSLEQMILDHLRDRLRFEGVVYTIVSFQPMGQLLNRDTIIGVTANKVRSDQYMWDPDFATARTASLAWTEDPDEF